MPLQYNEALTKRQKKKMNMVQRTLPSAYWVSLAGASTTHDYL